MKTRCAWVGTDPLYVKYHDTEWGVPVHDDEKLFEVIVLDAFQAGLSWITVLRKKENFRKAFDDFDPVKVAKYNAVKINNLLNDSGIIRNKAKINAAIVNAKVFLKTQNEFGTFDKYIWKFVNYKPVINRWNNPKDIHASTPLSDLLSKDMKQRGFKFCGTTICYAFMQAAGMVNDHLITCFRHSQIVKKYCKNT